MSVPGHSNSELFIWSIANFATLTSAFTEDFALDVNGAVKFHIELSPYGSGDLPSYIVVKLHMSHSDQPTDTAQCELYILKGDGTRYKILGGTLGISPSFPFTFSLMHTCPLQSTVPLDSENGLLPGGTLTLQCEVFKGRDTHMAVELPKVLSAEHLHLLSLLESGDLSDVTVEVGGRPFALHKAILARSPVMKRMFQGEFVEAKENRVVIEDVDAEVFEAFVRYLYTGSATGMEKYAVELLIVAEKYQLESLKRLCGEWLTSKLTVKTAARFLLLADTHNETALKNKCLDFIGEHLLQVHPTADWQAIPLVRRVDLIEEVLDRMDL